MLQLSRQRPCGVQSNSGPKSSHDAPAAAVLATNRFCQPWLVGQSSLIAMPRYRCCVAASVMSQHAEACPYGSSGPSNGLMMVQWWFPGSDQSTAQPAEFRRLSIAVT